ncbi:MAG: iron-containing redox enzyme family protein [Myxococcota bacterium]
MNNNSFKEGLLKIMERKEHWAWAGFTSGLVPEALLHHHFEQEYATYVRDFPVLVGWAYVQCPVAEVRRELAENLFEEETGGLVAGKPHPELFLEYPRGLGMDMRRFDDITLIPAAATYRSVLDRAVKDSGWQTAAAVATLFIEGTAHERGEVDENAPKRPVEPLDKHPLVVHYGLPLENLSLTKAHRQVEGEHRSSAWRIFLNYVDDQEVQQKILTVMEEALAAWLDYRDAVAELCGLKRGPGDIPTAI